MDDGKKFFLLSTSIFIMSLVIIFLLYDLIVSMNAHPPTPQNPSASTGVDISLIITQIFIIIAISSAALLVAVKWKEKKIKESKNNYNFKRLMKSRR